MSKPTTFKARDGQRMFSYNYDTDPDNVLLEMAWGFVNKEPICTINRCPASEGSYCVDCHIVGSAAKDLLAKRRANAT
jgi:hypothetical protein